MDNNGLVLIDVAELKLWKGNGVDLLDKKPDLKKYESQIQRNVRRMADRIGADAVSMCIVCGVTPVVKRAQDNRPRSSKEERRIRYKGGEYDGGLISAAAITAGLLRLGYPFDYIYKHHIDREFPKATVKQKVEELYAHPYRENLRILLLMEIAKVMKYSVSRCKDFNTAYDATSSELSQTRRQLRLAFVRLYPNDFIDYSGFWNRRVYGKLSIVSKCVECRKGRKQVQMRCSCGKVFWTDIVSVISGKTTACSFKCDVERNDDYTPVVIEVNSGIRFDSLRKAVKYFGLTADINKIRYNYRYRKKLYKHGDYIFCEGSKERNGLPPYILRKRFPEVGLKLGHRIPNDPIAKAARKAAEEKFANSKEGKRLYLERKLNEKWNETLTPIWSPQQLHEYREFVSERVESTKLRIASEDPILQGTAE